MQVPTGETLIFADDNFTNFEEVGIKEARKAAFVLVAGGLGERLGYNGIKVISLTYVIIFFFFLSCSILYFLWITMSTFDPPPPAWRFPQFCIGCVIGRFQVYVEVHWTPILIRNLALKLLTFCQSRFTLRVDKVFWCSLRDY